MGKDKELKRAKNTDLLYIIKLVSVKRRNGSEEEGQDGGEEGKEKRVKNIGKEERKGRREE